MLDLLCICWSIVFPLTIVEQSRSDSQWIRTRCRRSGGIKTAMEAFRQRTGLAWNWFCVQTKPHCEDFATINLVRRQIVVFNPKIEEVSKSRRARLRRPVPLFPSYIFARLFSLHDYYRVKWTPGVKIIVSSGETPIPVPSDVIETILNRLEKRDYFLEKRLKPGEKVTVRKGALQGLCGIFDSYCSGDERVRILLQLLHCEIRAELDASVL